MFQGFVFFKLLLGLSQNAGVFIYMGVECIAKEQIEQVAQEAPDFFLWEQEFVDIPQELPAENNGENKKLELLGKISVHSRAEESYSPETSSLKDALIKAASGCEKSYKLIWDNVSSDRSERRYKSGYVRNSIIEVDSDNKLMQHGQRMEDVYMNSLRYIQNPIIKKRAQIELRNGRQVQQCYEEGVFEKGYVFLVPSLVPDDATTKELDEAGFFTNNMSGCFQATAQVGNDLIVQTAFVAGSNSSEKSHSRSSSHSNRFDIAAVKRAALELGVDYGNASVEEILANPLLVHRSQLPNLAISFVEKYDQGLNTFYGKNYTGECDYLKHMTECEKRDKASEKEVKIVVEKLISESDRFICPSDATNRLNELNHEQLQHAIILDGSIDSSILGVVAKPYIEAARDYIRAGNETALLQAQESIRQFGISSSCPSGMKSGDQYLAGETSFGFQGEDKYGTLKFKCPKGHDNIRPRNKLIEKCEKCGTSVRC